MHAPVRNADELPATSGLAQLRNLSSYGKERTSPSMQAGRIDVDGSPQGSYRMSQVDIRQERVRAEFIDPEIFVQKVERIGDRHLQANQANQTHGHQYALSGRHSFETISYTLLQSSSTICRYRTLLNGVRGRMYDFPSISVVVFLSKSYTILENDALIKDIANFPNHQ